MASLFGDNISQCFAKVLIMQTPTVSYALMDNWPSRNGLSVEWPSGVGRLACFRSDTSFLHLSAQPVRQMGLSASLPHPPPQSLTPSAQPVSRCMEFG